MDDRVGSSQNDVFQSVFIGGDPDMLERGQHNGTSEKLSPRSRNFHFFSDFKKIFWVFGRVWIRLDLCGPLWMRSDLSRHDWTPLRPVLTCLEEIGFLDFCSTNFRRSGTFLIRGAYYYWGLLLGGSISTLVKTETATRIVFPVGGGLRGRGRTRTDRRRPTDTEGRTQTDGRDGRDCH